MKYVTRSKHGVIVDDDNEYVMGLREWINQCCILQLSTLDGRRDAAKALLGIHRTVPIPVSEEVVLLPLSSIRKLDCIVVNLRAIKWVDSLTTGTLIHFWDNTTLSTSISTDRLRKRIAMSETLFDLQFRTTYKKKVFTQVELS